MDSLCVFLSVVLCCVHYLFFKSYQYKLSEFMRSKVVFELSKVQLLKWHIHVITYCHDNQFFNIW